MVVFVWSKCGSGWTKVGCWFKRGRKDEMSSRGNFLATMQCGTSGNLVGIRDTGLYLR